MKETKTTKCRRKTQRDLLLSWSDVVNVRTNNVLPPKVKKETRERGNVANDEQQRQEQNDIVFWPPVVSNEEKRKDHHRHHHPSLSASSGAGVLDEKLLWGERMETVMKTTSTTDQRPQAEEQPSPDAVNVSLYKRRHRNQEYPLYDLEQRSEEDTIACQDRCGLNFIVEEELLEPTENVDQGKSITGQEEELCDAEGQQEDDQLNETPSEPSPVYSSPWERPGAYRLGQDGLQERVSFTGDVGDNEVESTIMPGPANRQLPSRRDDRTSSTNVILAEANLVVEPDLVEAKPLRQRRQLLVMLAIVVIVVIVGAVVAGIVVPRVSSSTSPTPIQTMKPQYTEPPKTPAPSEDSVVKAFRASLPDETNVAIDTKSTPQYKAFQWLTVADMQHSLQLQRMTLRFALATLYYSMNGDQWTSKTGWLNQSLHECFWYGCNCTEAKMVNSLILWQNGFGGTLPPELSLLRSTLETFELVGTVSLEGVTANQLHGTIPSRLGDLTNLEILYIFGTALTGRIPSEFGKLTKLRELDLALNQLSQVVPASLGNLTNLELLCLWGNPLTGRIPPEFGNLAKLTELELSRSQLSQSIPVALGNLTNLEFLYLWNNALTGRIPSEFGKLTKLRQLELYSNPFSQSIPVSLGNLTNLEILYLYDTDLTGTIPSDLHRLTKLFHLDLSNNKLVGTIPSFLSEFTDITLLYLSQNGLTGEIPSEFGELTKLTALSLYYNRINQWIPTTLGNLANLESLVLIGNSLTGTIPSELGRLTNLWELWLDENSLNGPIPTELGRLSLLNVLYLDNNALNQTIPTELARLTNLAELHLYENHLTGTIPSGLGELSNLIELFVNGNQLSGSMPLEVCNLIEENALNVTTDCNLVNCSCGCVCII